MDPQAERIARLERLAESLTSQAYHNTAGGIALSKAVIAATEAMEGYEKNIALNTATIESFERTIVNMQAQIDELKAGGAGDE